MHDVFGRQFEVGDIVTYPVRQSSSLWVQMGRVVQVNDDHIKVNIKPRWSQERKDVKLIRTDRVTIVRDL